MPSDRCGPDLAAKVAFLSDPSAYPESTSAVEAKEKIVVGANEFTIEEESPEILYIGDSVQRSQTAKLKNLRELRGNEEVRRRLEALLA